MHCGHAPALLRIGMNDPSRTRSVKVMTMTTRFSISAVPYEGRDVNGAGAGCIVRVSNAHGLTGMPAYIFLLRCSATPCVHVSRCGQSEQVQRGQWCRQHRAQADQPAGTALAWVRANFVLTSSRRRPDYPAGSRTWHDKSRRSLFPQSHERVFNDFSVPTCK